MSLQEITPFFHEDSRLYEGLIGANGKTIGQHCQQPGAGHIQANSAWGKSDHLAYLEDRQTIFEDEYERKLKRMHLVCAACDHLVTKVAEKIDVRGRHQYSFGNLGYPVKLGCFRNAPGCIGVQSISYGYSWFRGYAWQIQVCQACYIQLGWKYMAQDDSFYGLIFGMLREKDLEV